MPVIDPTFMLMKKIFLMIFLCCPLMILAQQQVFLVQVKIEHLENPSTARAYLRYSSNGKPALDSAKMSAGQFEFNGHVSEPCRAELSIAHSGTSSKTDEPDVLSLYLEKGHILVRAKDSLKHAEVQGPTLNSQHALYKKIVFDTERELQSVRSQWSKINVKDSTTRPLNDQLAARYKAGLITRKQFQIAFIKEHPDYEFSALLLSEVTGPLIDLEKTEPLYNGLGKAVRQSASGLTIGRAIALAKATSVGSMAPDFSQVDMNGRLITLTDLRGKYVFIDFWASWCSPCRAENPFVSKAHHDFKGKDFIVIGISLDKDKKAWQKAIEEDGLAYTQILDPRIPGNELARKYGISAIPQNFLIDPSGKIIGRNIHGADLHTKLQQIFDL